MTAFYNYLKIEMSGNASKALLFTFTHFHALCGGRSVCWFYQEKSGKRSLSAPIFA